MIELKKVAVIGAGTMGRGIAQVSASAGYAVILVDQSSSVLVAAREKIEQNLSKALTLAKITAAQKDEALSRLHLSEKIQEITDADLVIEAVPEIIDLKKKIIAQVSEVVSSRCILASNTSSLSISEIAQSSAHPERVIGLHFFNPVHIMKLLEIVHTTISSPGALEAAKNFAAALGKSPIVVKDSPGFATSRLGICFALEAIRMLEAGVASAEDIDAAMVLGYGHPMGPLKLTDLVGLDVRLAISEHLHRSLGGTTFAPPELLRKLVSEGKLGQKSGQGFYSYT